MKSFVPCLSGSLLIATLLSGCATLFDKDNTPQPQPLAPLPRNAPAVTVLWSTSTGGGATADYLRLTPAIHSGRIFSGSPSGQITALDQTNGKILWQTQTGLPLSGGVSVNNDLVLAGGRDGRLIALDQKTGQARWTLQASSEILSPPAVTSTRVVVKTIDGHVSAFAADTGKSLWTTFEKQPELILHGSSSPRISGESVYAGFENGTLSKYSLHKGTQRWNQTIATPTGIFPITRMVDIDSDPIITGNHVFTATWQGHIARLAADTGNIQWARPVSTYTALAYDGSAIYLSDASGNVHAFAARNGKTLWQQDTLGARQLTGPVLVQQLLVIGDAEGWVHFLDKRNGQLITRYQAGGGGVFATPVTDGNIIYLLTKNGQLTACRLVL